MGVERVVAGERSHLGAIPGEPLRQVRPDETVGAGDEDIEVTVIQGLLLFDDLPDAARFMLAAGQGVLEWLASNGRLRKLLHPNPQIVQG